MLVNRHTTWYWQPPSSRQSRYVLPHAASLYKTEMHTKFLGISSVVFRLFVFLRLLTVNMQFSDAVCGVAVELKAHYIFLNFKVWERNDTMCRWARTSNYEVRFCLSFSVLCCVSEPNIYLSTRFSTDSTRFVIQMDNPGFQPTTIWSKWQPYHQICISGCYKCTNRRLLITYQQNTCNGIELFSEVVISIEQAGWLT